MTDNSLGEFGSIARYLAPLAGAEGLGLLDDAALYAPPPGHELVLTKDAMVAGVHFFADDAPALVAGKLARVNLSDLAAMGAVPVGYLLAFALPRADAEGWMKGLAAGLADIQAAFGWTLWGGDTVVTDGPVTLSLTAIGSVPAGQALRRGGARAGDRIFVSGSIGDAALGLLVRQGLLALPRAEADFLLERLYRPSPRLALGQVLRGIASAAMDVSDGLVADLGHVAKASGLGARVIVERIPLSAVARRVTTDNPALFERIFEGDDYELLFTVPPARAPEIAAIGASLGLALTEIGEMIDGADVHLFHEGCAEAGPVTGGFRHF